MTRDILIEYIKEGISTRLIASRENLSLSTIRYWLRKHNLEVEYKTRRKIRRERKKKAPCVLCGRETHKRRCSSCYTKIRRYRTKVKAVKLLGGKCIRCGWNQDVVALEFHHNSGPKEFELGRNIAIKSWEKIKRELSKCILLCSNCHRIEHSKHNPKFIEEAM